MNHVQRYAAALLLLLMLVPMGVQAQSRSATATKAAAPFSASDFNVKHRPPMMVATPSSDDPFVGPMVTPFVSPAVRDLPDAPAYQAGTAFKEVPRGRREGIIPQPAGPRRADALRARSQILTGTTPDPLVSFDGLGFTGALPPDPNADVGPNHIVQMVNTVFAIYDKSGGLLVGPKAINTLWTDAGAGGTCASQNAGDPIVLYDQLADRWMLTQFTFGNDICVALSQTPDPTGSYFLYEFTMPSFPDYFKFGVFPEAYFMGANENSYTAVAFDRVNMLAGNAANFIRFAGETNLLMPADHDGPTAPPSGAPGILYTFKASSFHGGPDRLEIFEFDPDFSTPGNSTFGLAQTIPLTPFNYTVCGFFVFNCADQPGTNQGLDTVSEWPMFHLQYRNFGTHESLVGNFAVDATGANVAGIRWFELQRSGGGWTLEQEGTHSPDGQDRFMGSIAMDGDGNIGLGYSLTSNSTFPSLAYAVHEASDPDGTMQSEKTLAAGGGSQTSSSARWGDYSSLLVDPTDDLTFWYTGEYQPTTSSGGWRTRIGSFKVDGGGGGGGLELSCTPVNPPIVIGPGGGSFQYNFSLVNNGAVSETVDIWIVLSGPGVGRTLGPLSRTFGPGASLTRTFTQNIPAGAPAGSYTQTCNIGSFPAASDSDGFPWDKSASKSSATAAIVTDWNTNAEALLAEDTVQPVGFVLGQNYPNPFNPSTVITYQMAEAGPVSLRVFDALGREVAVLADGFRDVGAHQSRFDASGLSAGLYLYVLEAQGQRFTRQMMLLK